MVSQEFDKLTEESDARLQSLAALLDQSKKLNAQSAELVPMVGDALARFFGEFRDLQSRVAAIEERLGEHVIGD